jgi:acylphosphatase
MPDGTVEIEAEGPDESIEAFINELYKGPPASRVSEIDTRELSGKGKYGGFDVRF